MPTNRGRKKHRVRRPQISLSGGVRILRRSSWHWFDHPEMQARIAQAEADLAEGRYTHYTAEEFLKSLEGEK